VAFYVCENRITDKAMVHRGGCSFCNEGRGLHGRNTTNSSTWHGPFESAKEALATAKSLNRDHTDLCSRCTPLQPGPPGFVSSIA
jgi:hypothetical protein